VRLLDGVLELLEADPEFRHFTLDGQTVALQDYLEVRPEARPRIEALVRAGRLLVGPWFVLPDEWLVSGEALIRNLRLGLRQAEGFGGGMALGYVPDQFGHVGQLPQIFAAFGFESAVLWRGVGRDVERTLFRWEAPDGTGLLTVYLPFGYGNAVHLPSEPEALLRRLRFEVQRLEALSDVPTLLLMNGSDHVRPSPELPRALARAVPRLGGPGFEIGTLPGFVRRARAEAPERLPVHRGELRSGLRAPLLPGCASTRLWIKQADFRNDRLLVRRLEPLAAWLGALGGAPDLGQIDFAWRLALENHPHDSICGCSVDAVHEEMEGRFRRVEEVASAELDRVSGALAAQIAALGPGEGFAVWNPHPAGRAQVEAELELDLPRRGRRPGAFHLARADGRRLPAAAEVIEEERILAEVELPTQVVSWLLPALDGEFAGLRAQALAWRRRGERLRLEARLGAGPGRLDLEAVRRELAPRLEDARVRRVAFRARRPPRVRLRFVDELPGFGLRVYRVVPGSFGGEGLEAHSRPDGGGVLANGQWRVEVAPDGRVTLESLRHGVRIEDALRLVSDGDRGDEYNFDPVPGDTRVERPERVRVRVDGAAEAEASLEIEALYRVPRGLAPDRRRRRRERVALPVRMRLRLPRELDRVDVELELDHRAQDHRLRLHVRAPFAARRFEVESAFEVSGRPLAPAPDAFGSERPAELPIGACPQRSFASVDDGRLALTVANRGLAEVEAVAEPDGATSLALTVLRAVGWLSRGDLVLRPGDAGPPLPTPGAQVPGRHRAELSLRLQEAGGAERTLEAHRYACPPHAFGGLGAGPGRLGDGDALLAVDGPAVVMSAIEARRGGGALVRGYNASGVERRLEVAWLADPSRRIEPVDLAERRIPGLPDGRGKLALALRPWQIFSLRVH
jgi:hypothetical protein